MSDSSRHELDRRRFLKAGAAGAAAAMTTLRAEAAGRQAARTMSGMVELQVKPIDPVRIGYVGVGLQGSSHVRNLLHIPGVEIRAVCDIVPEKVARVQQWVVEAGQPEPEGYVKGPTDFRRLCQRNDLDLVYTATPWEWHVPVCLAAMAPASTAATEIPAATTLDECWQLVETAERDEEARHHDENRLRQARDAVPESGEEEACSARSCTPKPATAIDLRAIKFENKNEGLWRLAHSIRRTPICIPRMDWDRSRSVSTSTAAIATTTWSR